MPKEITYDRNGPFVRTPRGDEIRADHPDCPQGEGRTVLRRGVHVGWQRRYGYIELGVATFDASTESDDHGVYLDLDRDGVNRLIRTLRKARDAAFGSDA